jgi:hypothetical protein
MREVPDPIPDLKEQLRREIVALVGRWEPSVAGGLRCSVSTNREKAGSRRLVVRSRDVASRHNPVSD